MLLSFHFSPSPIRHHHHSYPTCTSPNLSLPPYRLPNENATPINEKNQAADAEAKATPTSDKGKGSTSNAGSSSSSKPKGKKKKDPEARARRKELSKAKATLGRLRRRVDGFWYSKLPFAGASGFRKRVLLVSEEGWW